MRPLTLSETVENLIRGIRGVFLLATNFTKTIPAIWMSSVRNTIFGVSRPGY